MAEKTKFYAAQAGFISGTHYEAHAPVLMHEAEARYLVLTGALIRELPAPKKETRDAGGAKSDKGGN